MKAQTTLEVEELAERRLRSDSHQDIKKISCRCSNGVLVLQGRVPTYYLKQVAQETVSRLNRAERIENQIEVIAPDSRQGPMLR